MLHDVVGHRCLLQRFTEVDADIIDELDVAAVFISGNGAAPEVYDQADLEGLATIVRSGRTPVLWFCGGPSADQRGTNGPLRSSSTIGCSQGRTAPQSPARTLEEWPDRFLPSHTAITGQPVLTER